jgi:hypothetical protein
MATGKDKRKKRRQRKPDNPAQSRRFIEAAKKLGGDTAGGDFEKLLDGLLKQKRKGGSK